MSSFFNRIVLNERPKGEIEPNTFRSEKVALSNLKPQDDEVLVQITWVSLDPAMRGYLKEARSYMPPVQIGEVMRAVGLGVVIEKGRNASLDLGQLVTGVFGWTEYAVMKEKDVQSITVPKGVQDIDFLNTLGITGYTAYFGLKEIGKLKAGETLVVSGAAGAVGTVACQLGKRAGAKVYAIAGTPEKCEQLEKELGVNKAFNYKSPTFRSDLKQIGYLDVFFDNVGGDILDICLTRLNKNARIILCGAISAYNAGKPKGLQNYLTLISQRAKIEGFIIFDYADRYPEALAELTKGLLDGSIKRKFHIVKGLENAPTALPLLFRGENKGKLLIQVAEPQKTNL